jgi:hypothetical protein
LKNETPAILAITIFEMPALPKGKRLWGCNVPFNIRKAAQVFTNLVGQLPSLASSNRWLHFG